MDPYEKLASIFSPKNKMVISQTEDNLLLLKEEILARSLNSRFVILPLDHTLEAQILGGKKNERGQIKEVGDLFEGLSEIHTTVFKNYLAIFKNLDPKEYLKVWNVTGVYSAIEMIQGSTYFYRNLQTLEINRETEVYLKMLNDILSSSPDVITYHEPSTLETLIGPREFKKLVVPVFQEIYSKTDWSKSRLFIPPSLMASLEKYEMFKKREEYVINDLKAEILALEKGTIFTIHQQELIVYEE